jgi:hypothetical protein
VDDVRHSSGLPHTCDGTRTTVEGPYVRDWLTAFATVLARQRTRAH